MVEKKIAESLQSVIKERDQMNAGRRSASKERLSIHGGLGSSAGLRIMAQKTKEDRLANIKDTVEQSIIKVKHYKPFTMIEKDCYDEIATEIVKQGVYEVFPQARLEAAAEMTVMEISDQ